MLILLTSSLLDVLTSIIDQCCVVEDSRLLVSGQLEYARSFHVKDAQGAVRRAMLCSLLMVLIMLVVWLVMATTSSHGSCSQSTQRHVNQDTVLTRTLNHVQCQQHATQCVTVTS